jgi:MFS family permease
MASKTLWHNRNFRLLFIGHSASNLGDGLSAVAIPWLATLLTHDPFLIGLVASCRSLPWFLFALPAGVLTDRFDHRKILISADVLRVGMVLGVMFLAMNALTMPGLDGLGLDGSGFHRLGLDGLGLDAGAVYVMAALSFLIGSAEVLRDNTAQTILPAVVETDQLEQANGAIWSFEQLCGQFIGPPLAGFLIGVSVTLPFGIQAALLVGAIASVTAMIRPNVTTGARVHLPIMAALQEGLMWLWRDKMLCRLAFILGGFNFIGYGFWAVFVIYGQRVLGLDAFGYGAFLTLTACGGLFATMVGPKILKHVSPTQAILFGMGVFTLCAALLAARPPLWVCAIVMVIDGFAGMLWNIAQVSYRQRHIPALLLGRVNSAFRFVGTGPAAFGALGFGALVAYAQGRSDIWTAAEAAALPFAIAALIGGGLTLYAALRLRLL